MPSPATAVRQKVKDIVAAEFAGEYTVADDKLPRAAGRNGTRAAVFPEAERQHPRRAVELIVPVILQIYHAYNAEPDENIAVDPGIIEAVGDRLRRRTSEFATGTTPDCWFIQLVEIEYPDDPTGNKSRLEARFEGRAENPAVQ